MKRLFASLDAVVIDARSPEDFDVKIAALFPSDDDVPYCQSGFSLETGP